MFLTWVSVVAIFSTLERANGEPVTQPDARVTVSQGEPVLLKCTYDPSQSPRLWWYEQHPNEAPRLLLGDYEAFSDEERRSRRGFSATPDKQGKTFHLKKSSSELRDSAVYYCAMSDTVIAPSRVAAQKPARGRGGGTKEVWVRAPEEQTLHSSSGVSDSHPAGVTVQRSNGVNGPDPRLLGLAGAQWKQMIQFLKMLKTSEELPRSQLSCPGSCQLRSEPLN
ncbi:uncharacterized protein LOC128846165 [Malaclemys terrapin pileata]|uniref:uncharacterized protein LOC128846165 n=1 Tax=Malaclemys terrapin pileata TaxID=2991368 RepID=UPI0023A7A89A|nr:uncharacterized protein LOC128846165 [Malaclemys terrapin pileata]